MTLCTYGTQHPGTQFNKDLSFREDISEIQKVFVKSELFIGCYTVDESLLLANLSSGNCINSVTLLHAPAGFGSRSAKLAF
jgi:hypothetical protein